MPPADPIAAGLESIAANVRRLRQEAGLTQFQLAAAAGVELRYIAQIEAGQANPSAMIMIRLSVALDVKPGDLFKPAKLTARGPGRPRKGT